MLKLLYFDYNYDGPLFLLQGGDLPLFKRLLEIHYFLPKHDMLKFTDFQFMDALYTEAAATASAPNKQIETQSHEQCSNL